MGARGPKPEPAAIKIAKGNPGQRKIGRDPEPKGAPSGERAPAAKVSPPTWLKGAGLRVWKRLAPQMTSMRLLSSIDAETFGRYCHNYGRWLALQKIIAGEGEIYETSSQWGTYKRLHPAFAAADRIEKRLEAIEDRFGLNPADRQRLYAARADKGGVDRGLFADEDDGRESKRQAAIDQLVVDDDEIIGALN